MTYLVQALMLTALALVLAGPVLVVAWKRKRPEIIKRFSIGAAAVGVMASLVTLSSDVLMERCRSAGNTGCLDFGSVGFQVLLFGLYAVVALGVAYGLTRN